MQGSETAGSAADDFTTNLSGPIKSVDSPTPRVAQVASEVMSGLPEQEAIANESYRVTPKQIRKSVQ